MVATRACAGAVSICRTGDFERVIAHHFAFLKSQRGDNAICRCAFRSHPGGNDRACRNISRRINLRSSIL
jgi:hypothetical protein